MSFTNKYFNYFYEFFYKIIGLKNLIFKKASNLHDADYRSICWVKTFPN